MTPPPNRRAFFDAVPRMPVVKDLPSISAPAVRAFSQLGPGEARMASARTFVPASMVAASDSWSDGAFPAYVPAAGDEGPQPLSYLVARACDALRPSSPVGRNRTLLLACVVQHMADASCAPVGACLRDAWATFVAQFDASEDARAELLADVEAVASALPSTGLLVVPGPEAVVHTYLAAAASARVARRAAFASRACAAADRLNAVLEDGISGAPDTVLAEASRAAHALRRFVDSGSGDRTPRVFVPRGFALAMGVEGPPFQEVDDPFAAAVAALESQVAELAPIAHAIGVAAGIAGAVPEPTHADGALPWAALPAEVIGAIEPPLVIHVEGADPSGDVDAEVWLSRLAGTSRAIHVLWLRNVSAAHGSLRHAWGPSSAGLDPLTVVMHREAFVFESTLWDAPRLYRDLRRMAAAPRMALAVVATVGAEPPGGAWAAATMLREARAGLTFTYDPGAGETWAHRFGVSDNPQPEREWPLRVLTYEADAGSHDLQLEVTFADAAALLAGWADQFVTLEPADWAEDQVPLADWLRSRRPSDQVPFIWAVDAEGVLARVLVGPAVVAATADAADRWRFVRALGGLGNRHAEAAAAHARTEVLEQAAADRRRLAEAHASALDDERGRARIRAIQQVASLLVGHGAVGSEADLPTPEGPPTVAASPVGSASPVPISEDAGQGVGHAAQGRSGKASESEERPVSFEAPWVDSALCTSCGECIGINPHMFAYNADKQAEIVDADAGTFEELVRAAEVCPARCIHICRPRSATEGAAPDLLARAAVLDALPAEERVPRTFSIDLWRCDGCTLCVEVCEPSAILDAPGTIALRIDQESCTSCGHCADVCPFDAVIVQ